MASSQSSVYTYDNINLFKQENFGMLAQQMQLKQGVVDQNKANLETLQRKIGIELDVAKEQDQKYIYERLSQAQGLINGSLRGGADLSSADVGGNLMRQLKETVEDKSIMNAVISTKKGRALMGYIQDVKENDPDKYNDRNAAVATKSWRNYLNGQGIGEVYAGGDYHDFVDFNDIFTSEKFNKYLKDAKINGVEWIQEAGGGGYFDMVKSYEGTENRARLEKAVQTFIGDRGMKQLSVDAEYYYGDGSDEMGIERFRTTYETDRLANIESLGKAIASEKERIKNLKGDEKEVAKEAIKNAEKTRNILQANTFEKQVLSSDGSINPRKYNALGTNHLYKNTVQEFTSLSYQDPILKDIDVNKFQFKNAEFGEKMARLKIAQEAHEMSKIKAAKEEKEEVKSSKMVSSFAGQKMFTDEGGIDVGEFETQLLDSSIEEIKAVVGNSDLDADAVSALHSHLESDKNWMESKEVVVIGGQRYNLADENVKASLLAFQAAYNGTNGTLSKMREAAGGFLTNVANDVIKGYKNNPDKIEKLIRESEIVSTEEAKELMRGIGGVEGILQALESGKNFTEDQRLIFEAVVYENVGFGGKNAKKIVGDNLSKRLQEKKIYNTLTRSTEEEATEGFSEGRNTYYYYKEQNKIIEYEGFNIKNEITDPQDVGTRLEQLRNTTRSFTPKYGATDIKKRLSFDGFVTYRSESVYKQQVKSIALQTNQAQSKVNILPNGHPAYEAIRRKSLIADEFKGNLVLKRVYDPKTRTAEKFEVGYQTVGRKSVSADGTTVSGKVTDIEWVKSFDKEDDSNLSYTGDELRAEGLDLSYGKETPYESTLATPGVQSLGTSGMEGGISISRYGSSKGTLGIVDRVKSQLRTRLETSTSAPEQKQLQKALSQIEKDVELFDSGSIEFTISPLQTGGNYYINMEYEETKTPVFDWNTGTLMPETVHGYISTTDLKAAKKGYFIRHLIDKYGYED